MQNDNPVFIAAISGIAGGYAWVIDGYINRTRTRKVYNGNTLIQTNIEQQHLMHCNWGWRGSSNGYYASGIFDVNNGPIETEPYESNWGSNMTPNYTWWFRTITYDNPYN